MCKYVCVCVGSLNAAVCGVGARKSARELQNEKIRAREQVEVGGQSYCAAAAAATAAATAMSGSTAKTTTRRSCVLILNRDG